ncbi:glycoside hydrolase TIM-barrel-like domain-containing protein [Brevundimonas faecalis]|uniref:baseplate multidomain protein megatron n=1 Tax=Brevundimonas faecalis TaxID=947378 RepID=UPI0036240ED2
MAQVVLSEAGRAIGGPIGQAVGSTLGRMLDQRLIASLSPARRGPRLEGLSLQSSADGAPMACVLGRARVVGQVIWAARFLEKKKERSGGKGGQRVVDYSYSLSFAVGLCEGPIDGVGRVWADGRPMDLSGVSMRVHRGTPDQAPDPLIEAVEGAAPAFRGAAYVVFEDLPLGPFGHRPPQLAFEIFRRPLGSERRLEDRLEGVCLIPGAGEFCLATEPVMRREGLTRTTAENVNNAEGRADLEVSLDHLMAQAPNLKRVSLVVGWFGDDVRAGRCRVRPGVERRMKPTEPLVWSAAGLDRGSANLISQAGDGPAYGGTPSDESVRQAIRSLKARGLETTLYPFVFMDCPGYPWRGRVAGTDGDGAAAEVAALFGGTEDWGLRRMALHYARIAAEEGADGLLIGSEMRGLTRTRDAGGGFPAVAQFRALAAECRAVVGPEISLSYAADWSEYFGVQGGGEARFPLDDLWADPNIDYVGIDWYPPLGDWRGGNGGLDAETHDGPSDPAYLALQTAGGEGYDWFYADEADRAAQARTPIRDEAHGEDWLWRPKDLKGWWSNPHHERIGGARSPTPTAWVPMMKPIRLTEFGCAATDRGANAPNLFQDPKSAESALPPHSTGARDDRMQRRALEAVLAHFDEAANNPVSPVYGGPMMAGADAWCWDARPWPAFPARAEVWADAGAWRTGHWLNGRLSGEAADLVAAVLRRGGLADEEFAVDALAGSVAGYVIDRPMRTRDTLEPLLAALGATAAERDGRVVVLGETPVEAVLALEALALPETGGSLVAERALSPAPDAARVRFIDETADYQTGAASVRAEDDPGEGPARGRGGGGLDLELPVVCGAAQALAVARRALAEDEGRAERLTARLGPLEALRLEPGDAVRVEGRDGDWRVMRLELDEQPSAMLAPLVVVRPGETVEAWRPGEGPRRPGAPFLKLADLPPLPGEEEDARPVAIVAADPWTPTTVHGGERADSLTPRATAERPATVGVLTQALAPGVVGRWDEVGAVVLRIEGGAPQSRSAGAVLGGANVLAVETAAGWEVLQHRRAELVGAGIWRLTGLLRGQQGSEAAAEAGAPEGAVAVFLERDMPRVEVAAGERGLPRLWRAAPAGAPPGGPGFAQADFAWKAEALRPWRPAQARVEVLADGGRRLSWTPRVRTGGDGWETEPVEVDPRRFRVRVMDGEVEVRVWEVEGLETLYPADQAAEDFPGGVGPGARARISQRGEAYGWGSEAETGL